MLSNYGKILRKLRIDKGELLSEMASKLGISSAYLSAIENSAKPIPTDLTNKIAIAYGLYAMQIEELKLAEDDAKQSIELALPTNLSGARRQTALAFARTFNSANISDDELEKIIAILQGGQKDDSE